MSDFLTRDSEHIERILQNIVSEAIRFFSGLNEHPAGATLPEAFAPTNLSDMGTGADAALSLFKKRYEPWLSGSAGSRYFGFVTGGSTPAALAGDWLTSVYDQNALGSDESVAARIELDTLTMLRSMFDLSDGHTGSFVSGATMANFVGLALGRQWVGREHGVDLAKKGLGAIPPIQVFSATPHSSVHKALSMLGMGRESMESVDCLPDREAIDPAALEEKLRTTDNAPCIVVANAGTLNTVDFDDLQAILDLKKQYRFWLHVDAAFGGFAACSPQFRDLLRGMDQADSITIDAHKWLNVPYDAAMQFTRHHDLQTQVFQNAAVYLGQDIGDSNFVHMTPENSRRLRALPSWFSLTAYGREGYRQIVEQTCSLAGRLGDYIEDSERFDLLAPVRLNGVCFTLKRETGNVDLEAVHRYLKKVQESGEVFLSPTVHKGIPGIRASITSWKITQTDLDRAWQAIQTAAQ